MCAAEPGMKFLVSCTDRAHAGETPPRIILSVEQCGSCVRILTFEIIADHGDWFIRISSVLNSYFESHPRTREECWSIVVLSARPPLSTKFQGLRWNVERVVMGGSYKYQNDATTETWFGSLKFLCCMFLVRGGGPSPPDLCAAEVAHRYRDSPALVVL